MVVIGQCPQSPNEQEELLDGRFTFFAGQTFSGLKHRLSGSPTLVVLGEIRPVASQRLNLVNRIQGAAFITLHVDEAEWLKASANSAGRLADSTRNNSLAPMGFRQDRDNSVGFTQLLGPQNDTGVSVCRHRTSLPCEASRAGPKSR